jgi:membrane protease YdiL (CAAX protease family)
VLIAFFFAGWMLLRGKRRPAAKLSFALMAVNLAFFIVSFFTVEMWNLDLESAKGLAFAKLSDGAVISTVLLASFFIGGFKPADIFLARGKLWVGLLAGLLGFSLMGYLAFRNPDQPLEKGFLAGNWAWILIFIFSNAFLEELLFRGIFLKPLEGYMKPFWAVVLTSVVFAAAHLQVTYTSEVLFFCALVLVLGFLWGLLMNYTKSIIASVLFHAGADLMIIVPVYATFGVNG